MDWPMFFHLSALHGILLSSFLTLVSTSFRLLSLRWDFNQLQSRPSNQLTIIGPHPLYRRLSPRRNRLSVMRSVAVVVLRLFLSSFWACPGKWNFVLTDSKESSLPQWSFDALFERVMVSTTATTIDWLIVAQQLSIHRPQRLSVS